MRTRVVHAASLLLVSALLLTGISSCGTTKPAVSTKPAMSAAATATTAASTSAGTKPSETIAESAETARPHYSMDLLLDTVNRTIGGTATVTVVNTGKDVMSEVVFRDYPSLFAPDGTTGYAADGAMTDLSGFLDKTNGSALLFKRDAADPSVVTVPLSIPIPAGQSRDISFSFTTHIPNLMSRFGVTDNVYNLGNFFPILAVNRDGSWINEPYVAWGECFVSACADFDVTVKSLRI